jgi:hypothetical protein
MRIKYFLLLITTILFLSCFVDKKNVVEKPTTVSKPNENLKTNIYASEEDIKEFITKNESLITENKYQISFIDKINLGIPGGDNWVVRLSKRSYNNDIRSNFLAVYAINNNGIEKCYYSVSFDLEQESNFNIMQDIPGIRIGDSTSSIGDFNGDGKNEIFTYGFGGNWFVIVIEGYDPEKDDFVDYCQIPFRLIDRKNGPAPVEFITYNGMYGFKVFYSAWEVALSYPSDPSPKSNKWFFYTWDKEQKKYIEVGEIE